MMTPKSERELDYREEGGCFKKKLGEGEEGKRRRNT